LGEATTFPHIVFSVAGGGGYIQMALFFPRLLKWSPEIVPVGVLGLWELITFMESDRDEV
jgi:hypothetical protein